MVVSMMFYFHPENWGNDPIWLEWPEHIFSTGLFKPPTTIIRPKTHETSRFWPPKNLVIESFKPFVSTKNHLLMGGAEPLYISNQQIRSKGTRSHLWFTTFRFTTKFWSWRWEMNTKSHLDGEMVGWLIQISIIWMDVKEENHAMISNANIYIYVYIYIFTSE